MKRAFKNTKNLYVGVLPWMFGMSAIDESYKAYIEKDVNLERLTCAVPMVSTVTLFWPVLIPSAAYVLYNGSELTFQIKSTITHTKD